MFWTRQLEIRNPPTLLIEIVGKQAWLIRQLRVASHNTLMIHAIMIWKSLSESMRKKKSTFSEVLVTGNLCKNTETKKYLG
jgi:hypothetical protein